MDLESFRRRLVYRIPGMGNARVHRDIVYQHDTAPDLLMDVYCPSDLPATARLPALCFIHGGPIKADLPLAPTAWGVYTDYGELAAASGFIGVTFNHRYYGFDQLPTAAQDIAAALAYVRAHANVFQIDPDRIGLWAFSGGGPFLSAFLRMPLSYIRCLVAYYALLDLQPLIPHLADVVSAATLRQFSPLDALQQAQTADIPLLIARAGRDRVEFNATIDEFVQAALTANLPLELLNHPGGQHAFDTLDDDQRSQAIIARTIAFLQQQLATDHGR
jgi:acetyl esterase/lipase